MSTEHEMLEIETFLEKVGALVKACLGLTFIWPYSLHTLYLHLDIIIVTTCLINDDQNYLL